MARSVTVGSCSSQGRPHGMRAAALRVEPDRQRVTVYLARAMAQPFLKNVAENPRLAIQVSNPLDHRTVQMKGFALRTRDADVAEHAHVQKYVEELAHTVEQIGIPAERVLRMNFWPATAFEVQVSAMFLQTPGPGAGQPLAGRAP